jgi:hypothetical protein
MVSWGGECHGVRYEGEVEVMSKMEGNMMREDRGLISQTSCLSRRGRRGRKRSGWRAEVGADSRDCRNDGSVVAARDVSSHMLLADQCRDARFFLWTLDREQKDEC